ncbi:MAG: response regulator transcription factor [Chitinophagales bacterium]|nr:response regulator transcription factor [Chitinophagales bacterium]
MNSQSPILIAIADDHAVVRDSISNMVSNFPMFKVCIKASNGKDLVEQLKKADPFPEICVLDVQMPEMNGYETMEYLKKHWPDLKVLALSMLEDEFAIIRMLKLGASGYLSKASDLEELQKALTYLYEKGYYSSEFIANNYFRSIKNEKQVTSNITQRQMEFLRYCCTELSMKEIADKMSISTSTALSYRNALCDKLELTTRQGLAIYAIKSGIVSFDDL